MPAIAYGVGAYSRNNGNLPELKLKNMFLGHTPSSETNSILLSRKGLVSYLNVGTGAVRAVFARQNVFGGDVFIVSGTTLYRQSVALGTIPGSGPYSFASGKSDELLICDGTSVHQYDGTSLSSVSFPDDNNISCIEFHDGLYLAAVAFSDKWYWSNVFDGTTWDPLNFATAEARPDVIRDIRILEDYLFLIGSESIEKWANTGAADIPYNRVEGTIIDKGAISTGCSVVTNANGASQLLFVGNDCIVYSLGNGLTRISDNGIEEKIAASSKVAAFTFNSEGHAFYCIRLDTQTFLFDLTTGQWCEFTTYNHTNWRACCACMDDKDVIFGDDSTGTLWKLDGWSDNGQPLERLFTAAFPIHGGVVVVDNITVEINSGWTELLAGQGSNPVVEIRSSKSAGATWSAWRQAPVGQQGQYRVKSSLKRLGMFDAPGGMFEIRITDPVPFRVSNVTINEAGGGRSR